MVEKGANVNSECTRGDTALSATLYCYRDFPTANNLKKFEFILEKVTRIDPVTPKPCVAPLEMAVLIDDCSIAKKLLDRGANVNLLLENNYLAINKAKSASMAQLLVDKGSLIDHVPCYCGTPLYAAVNRGNLELARVLINAGANLEYRYYGSTPLHAATTKGDLPMIELLLDSGAHIEAEKEDGRRSTPLMIASDESKLQVMKLLIKRGANLNYKSNYHMTALYHAIGKGDLVVAKLLVEAGADLECDCHGTRPLDYAVGANNVEMARMLLDHGALITRQENQDGYGLSLLRSACISSRLDMVRLLVQKGASVNEEDDIGETPLRSAAVRGDHDVVKLLIELGADVNVKDRVSGSTPLMLARSPEVIELLERAGSGTKAENNVDDTTGLPGVVASLPCEISIKDTPASRLQTEEEILEKGVVEIRFEATTPVHTKDEGQSVDQEGLPEIKALALVDEAASQAATVTPPTKDRPVINDTPTQDNSLTTSPPTKLPQVSINSATAPTTKKNRKHHFKRSLSVVPLLRRLYPNGGKKKEWSVLHTTMGLATLD